MTKKSVRLIFAALLIALVPSLVAQESTEAPAPEPEPTPLAAPAPQTFELLLIAPVPVGHRVEMRWYQEAVTGVLSGTRYVVQPEQ